MNTAIENAFFSECFLQLRLHCLFLMFLRTVELQKKNAVQEGEEI